MGKSNLVIHQELLSRHASYGACGEKDIHDTAAALSSTHFQQEGGREEAARQQAIDSHHAHFKKFTEYDAKLVKVMVRISRFRQFVKGFELHGRSR